jgi:hypothetical protein
MSAAIDNPMVRLSRLERRFAALMGASVMMGAAVVVLGVVVLGAPHLAPNDAKHVRASSESATVPPRVARAEGGTACDPMARTVLIELEGRVDELEEATIGLSGMRHYATAGDHETRLGTLERKLTELEHELDIPNRLDAALGRDSRLDALEEKLAALLAALGRGR